MAFDITKYLQQKNWVKSPILTKKPDVIPQFNSAWTKSFLTQGDVTTWQWVTSSATLWLPDNNGMPVMSSGWTPIKDETPTQNPLGTAYNILAPFEKPINVLQDFWVDYKKWLADTWKSINKWLWVWSDFILWNNTWLTEAKKTWKFLSDKDLDWKIKQVMDAMPDATDEEIATAISQLKNEWFIFEGINDAVDGKGMNRYMPQNQVLAWWMRMLGWLVEWATSGIWNLM